MTLTPHRIAADSYPQSVQRNVVISPMEQPAPLPRLLFLDLNDLPTAVRAAVEADGVGQLGTVALRALHDVGRAHTVVGATLVPP